MKLVVTRMTRILDVLYNASNNELVRTKTLVKNAIVQIDATPFKQWYEQHYKVKIGVKKAAKKAAAAAGEEVATDVKQSKAVQKKLLERQKLRTLVRIHSLRFISFHILLIGNRDILPFPCTLPLSCTYTAF